MMERRNELTKWVINTTVLQDGEMKIEKKNKGINACQEEED